jgi:hypothetical protein
MDLVTLFGEETAKVVKEKLGEDLIIINKKDGQWFPKAKWDEVNTELGNSKTELEAMKVEFGKVEQFTAENADLKAQVEKSKADLDNMKDGFEKERKLTKTTTTLKDKLIADGLKPKFVDDALRQFDIENTKIEGSEVLGYTDKLNSFKEDRKEWFPTDEKYTGTGSPPKSTGDQNKKWDDYNLTEKSLILKNQPELYKKLTGK